MIRVPMPPDGTTVCYVAPDPRPTEERHARLSDALMLGTLLGEVALFAPLAGETRKVAVMFTSPDRLFAWASALEMTDVVTGPVTPKLLKKLEAESVMIVVDPHPKDRLWILDIGAIGPLAPGGAG